MEHQPTTVGQQILSHRRPRPIHLRIKLSRQHRSAIGHTGRNRGRWDTNTQLCTKTLILLNSPHLSLFTQPSLPNLILSLLSEQLPGIIAGNRQAANVIDENLDTAASEEGGPPFNWHIQIQREHAQRDMRQLRRRWRRGRLSNVRLTVKHSVPDQFKVLVCWRGGQAAVHTRQKGQTR